MIKRLKRLKVEEKLKSLGLQVFTPQEFRSIFGVSRNTASQFITSNRTSGLFVKVRNNYYTLKDSHPSSYLIANKLYQPSYVSLEKALSHYGVIPEVVYTVTSVTTKLPREFTTPLGTFGYQRIKKEAFTGYSLHMVDGEKALFAEVEKALADYLYFVELKKVSLNDRLQLKRVNKKKLMQYAKLFQRPGMTKLIERVYAHAQKSRKVY